MSALPRSIPYLILNEASERYGLYGMRSILISFIVGYFYVSEQHALPVFHAFIALSYFFAIVGGFVGDRYGHKKYFMLLLISTFYAIGYFILSAACDIHTVYLGLVLIALCTGLIKPVIVGFVGDQFDLPAEHTAYATTMHLLFIAVNCGSTSAMIIAPYLLKNYGPTLAFTVPSVSITISMLFLIAGRRHYKARHDLPEARTIFSSIAGDKLLFVLAIFLLLSVFFTLFDQMFSVVVLQAKYMEAMLFDYHIMPALNPMLIILLSPLFGLLYAYLEKKRYVLKIFTKIQAGMWFACAAFFVLFIIQCLLDRGAVVSIAWQAIPFLFITIAEILIMPAGVAFAYMAAPYNAKCKSVAFFFLSVCIGNITGSAIVALCSNLSLIFAFSFILCVVSALALLPLFLCYEKRFKQ